jgi:hypothetical protein
MQVLEANISQKVADYLLNILNKNSLLESANQKLFNDFGIENFFEDNEELEDLKTALSVNKNIILEPDRAEYGDFQTNETLADKVAKYLISKTISPELVIEPTCGKGHFIIASLQNFDSIKSIYGIEIYKPYIWETKFNIIHFFLENTQCHKPIISINHCSVFDYDFKQISKKYPSETKILIIGNPPWVTNAKLGSLNSKNLPRKTNFKNHSGLDAMTGKGNFDIAEFITLQMLKTFQSMKGNMAFLVKNSVIKNIIFEQKTSKYPISNLEKHCIDSKKEFNASVEAALFYCKLNEGTAFDCEEFNFYDNFPFPSERVRERLQFGWSNDKFVSNIEAYQSTQNIDGECQFEWRQGLKHDCSSIMELDKVNGHYVNGLNEEIKLEDGLIYGILKSSDLKNTVINQTRKFTIVTQKRVGQATNFIKEDYPETYQYLSNHQAVFEARKSSIYLNKPAFSIFGIGDYSFKPYKIAISGLYKTFHFTLILPQNQKPVMLDDTCYLIGFDKLAFAVYTLILLNSDLTKRFLQSITFTDAKRTFTKDVLMRIDLLELANSIKKDELKAELEKLNEIYQLDLSLDLWKEFIDKLKPINQSQMLLFA